VSGDVLLTLPIPARERLDRLVLQVGAVDKAARRLWCMVAQAPDPRAPGVLALTERAAALDAEAGRLRRLHELTQAELVAADLRDRNQADRARARAGRRA
jgi:multidrug resistance efflux pump